MAVLQSRLNQIEMARQAQLNAQHTQSLTDITWGSQIRSYVLHVGLRLYISPLFLLDFDFLIISFNYFIYDTALPYGKRSQN
jgi:hypothetical protein